MMKKILSLIALSFIGFSSFAQLTVWKDTVQYPGSFPKDGSVYTLYDTIYNNTSSPLTLTWSKQSDNLLTGWSGLGICDQPIGGIGQCYGYSDVTIHSLTIPANGKGTIDVQMKALSTGDDGTSTVTVSTNAGNMVFKFVAWPSAVRDFDNNNLVSLYPNPASSFINISLNDKRINAINIMNVIGKRITRFDVDANRSNSIRVPLENVADGIYLMQFVDASGKVLGVRRVTKQ